MPKALMAEEYGSATRVISAMRTKDASAFNPRIGLFYDFSDTGSVYATIVRESRFPTIEDRYSYFGRCPLTRPWWKTWLPQSESWAAAW